MSSLYNEWNLLSGKIKSLLTTATFVHEKMRVNSSDPYNLRGDLKEAAKTSFNHIEQFKNDFKSSLPSEAMIDLETFIQKNAQYVSDNSSGTAPQGEQAAKLIVNLSLLENNVTYHLSNLQKHIRKTVEIAFAHLQRLIIVDRFVKKQWGRNNNKETDFERLGGAHLLLHKIWGFKVNADGARTDLVLSEPIRKGDPLCQSVDGLVLTEWKVVRDNMETIKKIADAKQQTGRYQQGLLGAVELSKYYYLVLVSKDYVEVTDSEENGITYRVINIAYNPSTPSKAKKSYAK